MISNVLTPFATTNALLNETLGSSGVILAIQRELIASKDENEK